MGPTKCYSQSQFMFECQSFRLVSPFLNFFLAIIPFFVFFNTKGYGHIDMLITFPW